MSWFKKKRPMGHGDLTRKYYVYLLYFLHNGREVPLYAGKGSGARVTDHQKILERKLARNLKLDTKERLMVLVTDLGYTVLWKIVDRDLTEDEAFNKEHETIVSLGLLQRGNNAYPHRLVTVQEAA